MKSLSNSDPDGCDITEYTKEALMETQQVSVSSPSDDTINKMSKDVVLMSELNINSQEQLFSAIDRLKNSIAERQLQINKLTDELSILNEKNLNGQQSDEEAKRGNIILLQIERIESGIDSDKEKVFQLTEIANKFVSIR